jgi:hypothetical protein
MIFICGVTGLYSVSCPSNDILSTVKRGVGQVICTPIICLFIYIRFSDMFFFWVSSKNFYLVSYVISIVCLFLFLVLLRYYLELNPTFFFKYLELIRRRLYNCLLSFCFFMQWNLILLFPVILLLLSSGFSELL